MVDVLLSNYFFLRRFMTCAFAVAAALAFGVFCPSIAKKIKSWFSKEASKTVASVQTDVKAVEKKL